MTRAPHQHRDGVVADADAPTHPLGVDTWGAVGAVKQRGSARSDRSARRGGSTVPRAVGSPRRSSRSALRRAAGRRAGPRGTPRRSPRSPQSAFWGHRLPQQLRGPPSDRELGLELGDPTTPDNQLRVVAAAHSRPKATVDLLLAANAARAQPRLRLRPQGRAPTAGLEPQDVSARERSRPVSCVNGASWAR